MTFDTQRLSQKSDALRTRSGRDCWGKTYRGTAAQLIDAGIVELRHLPGLGNSRRMSATFVDDQLISVGSRGKVSMVVRKLPGKSGRFEAFIRTPEGDYHKFIERCLDPVPGFDGRNSEWWLQCAALHWRMANGLRVNAMPGA